MVPTGSLSRMSTRDSGDCAAMRVTSEGERSQAAPVAAVPRKRLLLVVWFEFFMIYLAFICNTVREYGGKVRVKLVPMPSTLEVTGTILVGSAMEFVSVGLLALKVTARPLGSTAARPLNSMRRGCGVAARLTIFRKTVPVLVPRVALQKTVGTSWGGGADASGCGVPGRGRGGGACQRLVGMPSAVTGSTTSPR